MPKAKQFDEQDVLKKAKDIFCEKGYNGTSMDDLVQATGLSRSSIYDTFGDKHGLFLKSLNQYTCSQQGDLEALIQKAGTCKKKISAVFDYTVKDILSDTEGKGCLLINMSMELSCVDKEVAKIACDNMDTMEQRFAGWIKEGQASGEIPHHFTPRALARHLYNSLMGLRMTSRSRTDAQALKEVVKVTLSILDA